MIGQTIFHYKMTNWAGEVWVSSTEPKTPVMCGRDIFTAR